MCFFFGEEDYWDVMDEKESLHTDLAIKAARTSNVLFKSMLDYMIHHRDKKSIEFRKED